MAFISFLSFLLTSFKASLWLFFGILLKDHFETVLSIIFRKPIPEGLISPKNYQRTSNLIKTIGTILIIIGSIIILKAFASWIAGIISPLRHF